MPKTAIDAPRTNVFLLDPNKVVVVTDPKHPLYDDRVNWPLKESMIRSIMSRGVLEAIAVRKNGDALEVVYGRRRVLHAREANRRLIEKGEKPIRVKAEIARGDEGKHIGSNLASNLFEADSTMSKARKAQLAIEHGQTPEEVAVDMDVTVQCLINQWLPLLDLDPVIKKAIDDGKIAPSAAAPLAKLSRDEQKIKFAELMAAGPLPGAGEAVRAPRVTGRRAAAAARGQDPAPTKRMVRRVTIGLGENEDSVSGALATGFSWLLGEITTDVATARLPQLRKVVRAIEAAAEEKAKKKAERAKGKGKRKPRKA